MTVVIEAGRSSKRIGVGSLAISRLFQILAWRDISRQVQTDGGGYRLGSYTTRPEHDCIDDHIRSNCPAAV